MPLRQEVKSLTIQTRDWVYIYNPWVDGKTEVHNSDYTGSPTLLAMWKAAETVPSVRARVDFHKYRVMEGLYEVRQDPYAYVNVAAVPENAERVKAMRTSQWKLHRFFNRFELYDITKDEIEANNGAEANPEIVKSLATKMDAWADGLGAALSHQPASKKYHAEPKPEGEVRAVTVTVTDKAIRRCRTRRWWC